MRARWRPVVLTVVGLAALLTLVLVTGRRRPTESLWILEVEMRATAGTFAQLFWSEDLSFVEERSMRVPLQTHLDGFQMLRFRLPSDGPRWFRLDPTDAEAEVAIRQVRLLDARQRVIRSFDPASLKPANQVATFKRDGEVVRLRTAPGATDPFVFLALGCSADVALAERVSTVSPVSVAVASASVMTVLGLCLAIVGVATFRRAEPGPPGRRDSWWVPALWLGVLFLTVFSAKLLLMREYPLAVPFWDQWDAEARGLYVPYNECGLSWSQMFALHNEHRIFLTRLLALDLLLLNGQWDPRLQQVVNAAIHALTAVILAALVWVAGQRRRLDLLVLVLAIAFALPFAWENVLLGFQSAFYLLLLFSTLALWLTTSGTPDTAPWWLGWVCAVSALFTAAGGVIVPLAIVVVVGLKVADQPRLWRESLLTLCAAGAVLGLGIVTASPPLQHHAPLAARSVAEFAVALGRNLAWPWVDRPQVALLLWLPLIALVVGGAIRRGSSTPLERFIVGLGSWVVFQAGAIAYGRGAGAPEPAARYQDFLSLGFVANTVALVLLGLERTGDGTLARWLGRAALAGWLVLGAVGVDALVRDALIDLNSWRQHWSVQASNVRRFIISGDFAEFTAKRAPDVPYPDARSLASVLQDPFIRRILPASVRQPVPIVPRVLTGDAFVADGTYRSTPRDPSLRAWGSFGPAGDSGRGRLESDAIDGCQSAATLQFSVAGYLGWPRLSLVVKDLHSGRERKVLPGRVALEAWTSALVPCPPGPFVVIATDERADVWFAFREPVEIGRLSPWAERLVASSFRLLVLALVLGVLAVRLTSSYDSQIATRS